MRFNDWIGSEGLLLAIKQVFPPRSHLQLSSMLIMFHAKKVEQV